MCFKFPDWPPIVTGIGDAELLRRYAAQYAVPALPGGWICPSCGACWSPAMPGCLRCNGQGNRATNPLVDIVISPPAPADADKDL